jgi:glycosyltransferase involved in cell wall biosynthesis
MTNLIIIPARGEPLTLASVLDEVTTCFDADVLVLDGGGNGDLPAPGPRVTIVDAPVGNGYAVRAGLRFALDAGYQQIFRIDGDGQHNPGHLHAAQKALRVIGSGLVIGSRYHPDSADNDAGQVAPLDRSLLNNAIRHLVNELTGLRLTDVISGFWALDAATAAIVHPALTTGDYGLTIELILRLAGRAPIREIPHPRIYTGSAKMTDKYAVHNIAGRNLRAAEYLTLITTIATELGLRPGTATNAARS